MLSVKEKKKKECCGCGQCADICPKSAIKMSKDSEGFLYPEVDTTSCVNCGLCVKECSFNAIEHSQYDSQSFFVCRSLNIDVLENSASGGVFTHLSDRILRNNGIVFGATYDKDFSVIHKGTSDYNIRNTFRDSKYTQSNCEGIFSKVYEKLKDGHLVLFTGTPCQCAAVSRFVTRKNVDTSKLYLVDIICHGVGSPRVWKDYLDYSKKKYKLNNIDRIITRNKKIGDGYNLTLYSKDIQIVREDVQDPYIMLFSHNLILRPSCFACPFKTWARCTDITIGDFQKVKMYYPQFADQKGVSVVIVNTNKGNELLGSIKDELVIVKTNKEKSSQVNLYQQIDGYEKRELFFKYFLSHSFSATLKKYTEEGFVNRLIGVTKRFIKGVVK